jgi:peptide deformylase
MAVLPIRITGDEVLHTAALPVTTFDAALAKLVDDMFDTMEVAPGVGLAAPQVGVPLRIFVFNWVDDLEERWRGVAINPEILISPPPVGPADSDTELEGCLSIPGERFPLRRADITVLSAIDQAGKPYEISAQGWLARIFQHEFDHLNGILYADRLAGPKASAVNRAIRKHGWGEPGLSWLPGLDHPEG